MAVFTPQLAAADSIGFRVGMSAMMLIAGAVLILSGINSIRTKTATETGKRRTVNRLLGRDNTYRGASAVFIGWSRVIVGIGLILFGIVFVFVGPFLAS